MLHVIVIGQPTFQPQDSYYNFVIFYLVINELNADSSFDVGQPAIEPQWDFEGLPGCQVLGNRCCSGLVFLPTKFRDGQQKRKSGEECLVVIFLELLIVITILNSEFMITK